MNIIVNLYKHLPTTIKRKTNRLYKYLPRSKKIVIKKIDGITYQLDLSRLSHAQIYHYGCWEKYTTEIIKKNVKEGMTVLDIGASSGVHTLRLAKLVGKKGKVYAFEPSSWMIKRLLKNIELNNFLNVIVTKVALSNTNEKGKIMGTTHGRLGIKNPTSEDIEEDIDFIKVDVDGYECKIVKGGLKTLKKFKPLMVIELSKKYQEKFGESVEELIGLLKSVGYSFYKEQTLEKYTEEELDKETTEGVINVLCKA